jgi:hypothetical protein
MRTGDKRHQLGDAETNRVQQDRNLHDNVNRRQEATSMDEARVKDREEIDSIHFANVLYWREGTTHSHAATMEYLQRQTRLREIRAAQLSEFDS